jgi:hypothetical protein
LTATRRPAYRGGVRIASAAVACALVAAGCSLECSRADVLRIVLTPIPPRTSGGGTGGASWPRGAPPPEIAPLVAALLLGEGGAGSLRLTAAIDGDRLLFLELPATATTGLTVQLEGPVEDVEFTGGYGERFGWWDSSWRAFEARRPPRASLIDPFSQQLSAVTSSGSVTWTATAPWALLVDVTSEQRSGPTARVRAEAALVLEEDREVCQR